MNIFGMLTGEPATSPKPPSELRSWCLVPPRVLFESPDPSDWEGHCRRLSFGVFVGDDTVLCRTLARFKMFVSSKDEGLAPHLIGDGYWEMWVTKAITDVVQPGMVCIDAGANVGYYTVLLADLVGAEGRVVAAEPIAPTRELLQRNLSINGFEAVAEVLGVAFGAGDGDVTLFMPPGEPKNAFISARPHPGWESFTVPQRRIDELGLSRVDFVKIDVEGGEFSVWRGMKKTIRDNPCIQIIMEVNCKRYPEDAREFLAEISAQFPLRLINVAGARVPTTVEELLSAEHDVMLYLARPSALGQQAPPQA